MVVAYRSNGGKLNIITCEIEISNLIEIDLFCTGT